MATCVLRTAALAFFTYCGIAASNLSTPSPNQAWYPPEFNEYETELSRGHVESEGRKVTVDPDKVYDLPALIDIAERTNPQTRIAWERATRDTVVQEVWKARTDLETALRKQESAARLRTADMRLT